MSKPLKRLILHVLWHDAFYSDDPEWAETDGLLEEVGWFITETDKYLSIGMELNVEENGALYPGRKLLHIPKVNIIKIKRIKI